MGVSPTPWYKPQILLADYPKIEKQRDNTIKLPKKDQNVIKSNFTIIIAM